MIDIWVNVPQMSLLGIQGDLLLRDVLRAIYRLPVKDDADEYSLVKSLIGKEDTLNLYGGSFKRRENALQVLTCKLEDVISQSFQKEYILKELVAAFQLMSIESWGIPIHKNTLKIECQKALVLYQESYNELQKMAFAEGIELEPEIIYKRFSFSAESPALNNQLAKVRKLWKHTLLLDYEKLAKYIHGDRLFCKWENYAAVSGRIQSHEPNVQGFPKTVRERCILPNNGNVLIRADYVSEELVLMAILAKDTQLLGDIRCGVDLHARMAAMLFDKDVDVVLDEERKLSKRMTFACLYGAGCNTLKAMANEVDMLKNLSGSAIQRIIKNGYPAMKALEERSKKTNQIVLIDGSVLKLSDIKKQYSAVNRMIQGSGSIILKQVMDDLFKQLPEEARIVCLIHDEVIVEVPKEKEEHCIRIVSDVMCNVLSNYEIDVEMPVDVAGIGGLL